MENGALCGRGDISMESFPGPGEEEGGGGVVAHSTVSLSFRVFYMLTSIPRPLIVPNKFWENSDRRGVGSWGL